MWVVHQNLTQKTFGETVPGEIWATRGAGNAQYAFFLTLPEGKYAPIDLDNPNGDLIPGPDADSDIEELRANYPTCHTVLLRWED